MSVATLNTLLGYYIMTMIINITIATLQFFSKKDRVHITILLYWIGLLLSASMNIFITNISFLGVTMLTFGTFISQLILGDFFCRLHSVSLPWKYLTVFFLASIGMSYALTLMGYDLEKNFTICVLPLGFSSPLPLVVACYRAWKYKSRPFSLIQKIFVAVAVLMSLHYLDWVYTRPRIEYFTIGLAIAIFLLNTLSVLTPMMANEYSLQSRMRDLETEVRVRAEKLTQAEKQLWESNKFASIGRMAGGIAHEINNPLSIISMCTENLQEQARKKLLEPESVLKDTDQINKVVNRISNVTSNLRKVARDHRDIEKRDYDFVEMIQEILSYSHDRLKQNEVNLVFNPPRIHPHVFCNPVEISQVLLNLLNNAIDAIENLPKKEIQIILTQAGNRMNLIIEDNGKLDPKILPQIMDPFFTTKPFGQGSGLGLSISKSIIESYGGHISVDLQTGRTRFIIELATSTTDQH